MFEKNEQITILIHIDIGISMIEIMNVYDTIHTQNLLCDLTHLNGRLPYLLRAQRNEIVFYAMSILIIIMKTNYINIIHSLKE